MARTPTGNPRGRPKGSGRLTPAQPGEKAQTRVTVRLPTALYDRLEAFAAGRRCHRGRLQVARWVREALEEYLDRHSQRQTPQTAEAPPQTPRTRAAARSEATKTLRTEPREEAPPWEGTDSP